MGVGTSSYYSVSFNIGFPLGILYFSQEANKSTHSGAVKLSFTENIQRKRIHGYII